MRVYIFKNALKTVQQEIVWKKVSRPNIGNSVFLEGVHSYFHTRNRFTGKNTT